MLHLLGFLHYFPKIHKSFLVTVVYNLTGEWITRQTPAKCFYMHDRCLFSGGGVPHIPQKAPFPRVWFRSSKRVRKAAHPPRSAIPERPHCGRRKRAPLAGTLPSPLPLSPRQPLGSSGPADLPVLDIPHTQTVHVVFCVWLLSHVILSWSDHTVACTTIMHYFLSKHLS